jgi:hypothetical protein
MPVDSGASSPDRPVAGRGRGALAALRSSPWGAVLGLAALLGVAELTYWDFSWLARAQPDFSPQGAAAGFWWAASVFWMTAALRRPAPPAGAPPPWVADRMFRAYALLAFSALSAVEIAAEGMAAIRGFQVGGGLFAAAFCLADLMQWMFARGAQRR